MGPKIDKKSRWHRGGVRGGPLEAKCRKPGKVLGPILGPVFVKTEKILFEKASQNQCKTISKFEAKGGPKMMPKWVRKSRIFLNGPRWVVLRKSSFYNSKTMV